MRGMKARWELVLLPPFVLTMAILVASQYVFIKGSFHRDLGFGELDTEVEFVNYVTAFVDPYYLDVLLLSIRVSAVTTAVILVAAIPIAYIVSRMASRWSMVILSLIVVASIVTIAVKVLGIIVLFSPDGVINKTLLSLGLIERSFTILGTMFGVVVGLMYYSLGFAVLLIYSVMLTIPRNLEEAALSLGASRASMWRRVIVPLSLPGIVGCALMVFNISMGGFASTALIGAGKIITLPVIVQRTVIVETNYGMGAALAVLLLVSVVLINLLSVAAVRRLRRGPPITV
jgi:putative spermidine/putrescine transport system permease protein